MSEFTINVRVNVGVTPELLSVLSNLLSHPKTVEAGAATAVVPPTTISNNAPVVKSDPVPEPQTPTEKEYTEVDVRAAMDKCRKRIEGEDWKQNTDTEEYKKYHKPLTALFKKIASIYGSDKPSTLPDSEKRKFFIEDCAMIMIGTDDLPYVNDEDLPF